MRRVWAALHWPALVSTLLVLPFLILELVNRRAYRALEGFPFMLFAMLWLLPAAFVLILAPLVRDVRAGRRPATLGLVVRVAFMLLIAAGWGRLIVDQMPCFLGLPNCD